MSMQPGSERDARTLATLTKIEHAARTAREALCLHAEAQAAAQQVQIGNPGTMESIAGRIGRQVGQAPNGQSPGGVHLPPSEAEVAAAMLDKQAEMATVECVRQAAELSRIYGIQVKFPGS